MRTRWRYSVNASGFGEFPPEWVLYLRVLLSPGTWIRLRPSSKALDKWMRSALHNPTWGRRGEYHVNLNGFEVWAANYPTAYGSLSEGPDTISLPSRRTVLLLCDLEKFKEMEGKESIEQYITRKIVSRGENK